IWRSAADIAARFAKHLNGSDEIEGAWWGNDTIWRTCLDLNRILLYGRSDGTLADSPQRKVIHVVDAVTAGQGDGPLAPDALPMGLLLAGANAPAVDWICVQLLGFDPHRIPISRHAFSKFRWPLVSDSPEAVRAVGEGLGSDFDPGSFFSGEIKHPAGWLGAVSSKELSGD
ncbi:MAG: DUF362 domain-containing protein, partial [Gemmatimonadetes bacterium]|nr:DUF362 domain-containing protein [Gemmatimonadota bacterium]